MNDRAADRATRLQLDQGEAAHILVIPHSAAILAAQAERYPIILAGFFVDLHIAAIDRGGVGAGVNLADREDFEYDILIGREFLASRVLVDSASTFIADDECNVSERD